MGLFSNIILRRFRDIAPIYEEILKAYKEFLLTEEELEIPTVTRILIPLDRYSDPLPESVIEYISSFPGSRVGLIYVIDEDVCRVIRETIGDKDAEIFREKEFKKGEETLNATKKLIEDLNLNHIISSQIKIGNKATIIEHESEDYDILIVSRYYGATMVKTYQVSPIVFRILQNVEKPVIIY
ncbi:hypothetical protein [Pyrococcus horikoshii]|uniref:Universal stress protein n=1 Tax=Pyrococcus horikoshii TaxID=53953 RepID=A0A832WI11_PYRHR|nr:hypothetical protein [Pyrococcus horikoshii]HII61715.1 universal stress protein [Pyrococcus horikoshii]